MNDLDKIMMVAGLCFLLLFVICFMSYQGIKDACEEKRMKITGSLDCRDGDEFYEVYPEGAFNFKYIVNKHPKTER